MVFKHASNVTLADVPVIRLETSLLFKNGTKKGICWLTCLGLSELPKIWTLHSNWMSRDGKRITLHPS